MNNLLGKNVFVNNIYFDEKENTVCGTTNYDNMNIKTYILDEKINKKIKIDKGKLSSNTYQGIVVAIFVDKDSEKVIAIVNDVEDNIDYTFVTGFFVSRKIKLNMKCKCINEKSCGAIVYYIDKNENRNTNKNVKRCLIIKSKKGFYGFPKGHLEYNETEKEAAIREVFEETGINISIDNDLREIVKYKVYDEPINKQVVFYLSKISEIQKEKLRIEESELTEFFFYTLEEARKILNDDLYNILLKADAYANEKENQIKSN